VTSNQPQNNSRQGLMCPNGHAAAQSVLICRPATARGCWNRDPSTSADIPTLLAPSCTKLVENRPPKSGGGGKKRLGKIGVYVYILRKQ